MTRIAIPTRQSAPQAGLTSAPRTSPLNIPSEKALRMSKQLAFLAAVLAWPLAVSHSMAQESQHPMHEGPSVSIPADQVKFGPSGVKTDKGELLAGPAYGDMLHGRHGTFVLMPHGFVSPVHTHTQDYYAVVLKGVGANQLPGGKVIPLPVGSYWFQKGE
jgi:hypothetical protein